MLAVGGWHVANGGKLVLLAASTKIHLGVLGVQKSSRSKKIQLGVGKSIPGGGVSSKFPRFFNI